MRQPEQDTRDAVQALFEHYVTEQLSVSSSSRQAVFAACRAAVVKVVDESLYSAIKTANQARTIRRDRA